MKQGTSRPMGRFFVVLISVLVACWVPRAVAADEAGIGPPDASSAGASGGDRGPSSGLGVRLASLRTTVRKSSSAAAIGTTAKVGSVGTTSIAVTQISGIVYRADGNTAKGTVLIAWPGFTTANGDVIAAGSLSVQLGEDGSFAAGLAPNTGATPTGTYYRVVYQLDDGANPNKEEYWMVPATQSTTIAAVRAKLVPANVAAQFVTRDLADSAYVHASGDQTVSGVKTFSSSPSVPAPQNASDAATKSYVDANAGGMPIVLDVRTQGVKGDAKRVTDGAMTAGQSIVTAVTSRPFAASDVGKAIWIAGAGAAQGDLNTTITGFTTAGQVTVAAAASTTVGGATLDFGSDNAAPLQAMLNNNAGKHIFFPKLGASNSGGGSITSCEYLSSQPLTLAGNSQWLEGQVGGQWSGGACIRFPQGVPGIVVPKDCYSCRISHLELDSNDNAYQRSANAADHGIEFRGGEVEIEHTMVMGFGGHCYYSHEDGAQGFNTDIARVTSNMADGCGLDGFFNSGSPGVYMVNDARSNKGHGFEDVSVYGATYVANHASGNGGRPYFCNSGGAAGSAVFVGNYSEGNNGAASSLAGCPYAMLFGGWNGQAVDTTTGYPIIENVGNARPLAQAGTRTYLQVWNQKDEDGFVSVASGLNGERATHLAWENSQAPSAPWRWSWKKDGGDSFFLWDFTAGANPGSYLGGDWKLKAEPGANGSVHLRGNGAGGVDVNSDGGTGGFTVYDGVGHDATNVVASFGPNGVSFNQIGSKKVQTSGDLVVGGALTAGDVSPRDIPGHEYFVSKYGSIQAAIDAAYNNGNVLGGAIVVDDRTAPYTGPGWIVRDSVTLKLAATTYTINGTVQYNNGVALVTAGLISMPGSHIVGAGTSANHGTNINAANGLNADLIATSTVGSGRSQTAQWWHWGSLEGFHMDGNKSHQTAGNCINVENMGETAVLRAIEAGNCYGDDIRLEGNFATQSEIANLTVNSAGQYGVNLDNFQGVGVLRGLSGDSNAVSIIRFNGNQSATLTVLGLKSEEEISGQDPLITIDMPADGSQPALYLVGGYTYGRAGLHDVIKIVNGKAGAAPFVQVSNFYVDTNFANAVNDTVNGRTFLAANMNKVPFSYLPTGAYMSGQAFTFAPGTYIQGGQSALTEIFGSNTDSSTMIAAQGNGDGSSYFTGGLKFGIPNRQQFGSTPEMMARMGSRFLGAGNGYDANTWVFVPIWKTGDASNRWIGEPNQRWPEVYAADVNSTTATIGNLTVTNCTGCAGAKGDHLLSYQTNTATLTGNGTDQAIYTYAMPAASMTAGTGAHCYLKAQRVSGTGSITYKWKFGGTTVSYAAVTSSSVSIGTEMEVFNNPGSTTAQIINLGELHTGNTITAGALLNTAAAENTANAVTVSISFNGASTEQVKGVTFKCIAEQ